MATFREQMADYAKGAALRELRAGLRLSREKVAAEIGVTTKTLYEWENDGGIKFENASKLAAFYGIDDVETLITRSTDGGDQLARIERQLETLVGAVGRIEAAVTGIADRQDELEAGLSLLAGSLDAQRDAQAGHASVRGPRAGTKATRSAQRAG